jgi:soluble lytic murein transglycosylase-like protein
LYYRNVTQLQRAVEIFPQHQSARIKVVIIRYYRYRQGDESARRVRRALAAVLFSCGMCVAASAAADVFHFVAEDGTSHFSDQPSDSRFRLLLRTNREVHASLPRAASGQGLREARRRFEREISAAAQASQIDVALLNAVIEIESGYNPRAVSPKGALGLMQLMPDTARHYGVVDPLDAAQNLRGGARLLRDLLNQFSEDKELALAAYNAGAGAVMRHGRKVPPYAETIRYVPAVLKSYERLLTAR